MNTIFLISVPVLAVLLFFPISKLIWVLSIRRLQRKLKRDLSPQEIEGQTARARVIAAPVALIFSYLFNLQTVGNSGLG
ncbi:MAG: hypothetical protein GY862_34845 [Gammaproteobacteria bacterium]|nr:hypothetical protein [Gammaproteobacteria bacterium]